MLLVENLTKIYRTSTRNSFFKRTKTTVEAVKNFSMEIREGQIVGLLGINGAGKTTTIKMLSTLLTPTAGRITVDGMDGVKQAMEVKKIINMVAGGERMIYWRLTGRENLIYYGRLYGLSGKGLEKRIDQLLELVGLVDKQNEPVEQYSKGMKQRLQIARGLVNDPRYIFMDEPTLGLDAPIAKDLRSYVKTLSAREGKSILLTSHYMPEVEELCEYIYVLDKGRLIAQGTPKELAALGRDRKVLRLEVQIPDTGLLGGLTQACRSVERDCVVELDEGGAYIITSAADLSNTVAGLLLDRQIPIRSFHTEEPRLEDAIIKLARGA